MGSILTLRNHVGFDAPEFIDNQMVGDDNTGEGDWPPGAKLATRLVDGLTNRGFDAADQASTGYSRFFLVANRTLQAAVEVGYAGDGQGRQWLVFVEPERRGFFRRTHPDVSPLLESLHEVLVDDLGVSPTWFSAEEWDNPGFGDGAPSPSGR